MASNSFDFILYLPAISSPVQKEVSITVLRIPSESDSSKAPDVWRINKWKRFEDNEPTKVLEHDCVGATWLIFICPSRAALLWMKSLLWPRKDFHADRLFVKYFFVWWLFSVIDFQWKIWMPGIDLQKSIPSLSRQISLNTIRVGEDFVCLIIPSTSMRFKVIDLIGSSDLFPKRKYFTHFREKRQKIYDTKWFLFISATVKVICARISIIYTKARLLNRCCRFAFVLQQIPILDSIIKTHSVIKSHARLPGLFSRTSLRAIKDTQRILKCLFN